MKINDLRGKIANVLELNPEDITDSFNFSTQEEYDSLAVLGLIAFISESFNKTFSAVQLMELTSLQSLIDLIGKENFEE